MARCEDYPCCGCGPEGCIDFEEIVTCEKCGKQYHPDDNTWVYCYGCQVESGEYDGDSME